jgi:hypothetical protein
MNASHSDEEFSTELELLKISAMQNRGKAPKKALIEPEPMEAEFNNSSFRKFYCKICMENKVGFDNKQKIDCRRLEILTNKSKICVTIVLIRFLVSF